MVKAACSRFREFSVIGVTEAVCPSRHGAEREFTLDSRGLHQAPGMDGYSPGTSAMTLADRHIAGAFVLAMRAELATAPYGSPHAIGAARPEWLIVSRWGLAGECLSLSRTGVPALADDTAPANLHPRETFFGLRVPGSANETCFLLLRHLPAEIPVAGSFLPTDGFVRLAGPMSTLRLTAAGRHAHIRGRGTDGTLYGDVPCPPEDAEGATAWSIDATRRPWLGEFVERLPGRQN
jgi:hypothetical protein